MRYGILKGLQLKGVAHFVDEAQEFAERFSGIKHIDWAENGEMVHSNGRPTGWKLVKM